MISKIKLLICVSVLIFLVGNVNAGERPLVKIIDREIVEWHTISRTIPQCGMAGCLVMHYTTLNQLGTKYLAKFAQIKWKGQIKEIELDRVEIKSNEILQRSIAEEPYGINFNN